MGDYDRYMTNKMLSQKDTKVDGEYLPMERRVGAALDASEAASAAAERIRLFLLRYLQDLFRGGQNLLGRPNGEAEFLQWMSEGQRLSLAYGDGHESGDEITPLNLDDLRILLERL